MGTDDEAKIAIHYVEEWLKRVETKINEQDGRFARIENRVAQLAEVGYVAREKYDADIKEQRIVCANRHEAVNVQIDSVKVQQSLWTGNAQIIRWFVMVVGAAAIVMLFNQIPKWIP